MKTRSTVPVLALVFSLTLHAAAFAALLVDWREPPIDEPVLSVELVIVSSPLESESIEESTEAMADRNAPPPQAAPQTAVPDPVPPPPMPVQEAAPPPPSPEPAPSAPPPPKVAKKPEPPKAVVPPAPKPAPAPRAFEPPINLNPGTLSDAPQQQARAPSSSENANSFSVLYGPIPPYPAAARSRGQEGRVVLEVVIGIDGVPTDVAVARSSGVSLLDDSALATVKTWRFRNDSGRALPVTVPIVFELRAAAKPLNRP